MTRTNIDNSEVLDADFALQAELDAVKDNSTSTFVAGTMNNKTLLDAVTALNTKSMLFPAQAAISVAVPAAQNYVLLTGTSKPAQAIAYGATSAGAICNKLVGAIGTHSTGYNANYTNLCAVRDPATREALFSSGEPIYALLQVASTAVDGTAYADSGTSQGQLSFVTFNFQAPDPDVVPAADIASKTVEYVPMRRLGFTNLPEDFFSYPQLGLANRFGVQNTDVVDLAETSVTGTTWTTKLTATFTVAVAGRYRIGWQCTGRASSATGEQEFRVTVDGTSTGDLWTPRYPATATTYHQPMSGFTYANLTAASHTILFQFHSLNAGQTHYVSNARMEIWKV